MVIWVSEHAGAVWLALAAVLAGLELISLDLVLAMLAGGALSGGLLATVGAPVPLQLGVAIITSLGLLYVVRPSMAKRLHNGPDLKTGAEALIGLRATVLREITYSAPGRVKIGGEEWTAAPYDEDDRIEPGAIVDVVSIKGATAYVLRTLQLP